MKRVFALLLACVMLFSFAACGETPAPTVQPEPEPAPSEPVQTEPEPAAPAEPEPAAEPEPEPVPLTNTPVDKETAVQALYTVVKAYFNKNPYTQYEGKSMSIEGKWPGPQRIHHYAPPEYASADQAHFSQCTDYVSTLYYQAFGYEFMDGLNAPPTDTMMKKLTADDGLIFYRDDVTDANVQEVIREYRAMLEPGDFIISNGETGHALMWLGDFYGDGVNYITHCWGKPFVPETGEDPWEPNGGIRIQTEDVACFPDTAEKPWWDLTLPIRNRDYLAIIRPFAAKDFVFEITPQTAARMKYPEMVIDRYTDVTKYQDVLPGQEITVTVSVTNKSTEDYKGVALKETVPEGVTLKTGETEWTVDVPAGQTVTRSYTATVTAPRLSLITFAPGSVDCIPTREMIYQVGGAHLNADQETEMMKIFVGYLPDSLKTPGLTELKFANDFYREVLGIELNLPESMNDYLGIRFKKKNKLGTETKMLTPKDAAAEYQYLVDMELYQHIGGMYMTLGTDASTRAMEYREEYYRPGDIILTMSDPSTTTLLNKAHLNVYIYIGNGLVLRQDEQKGAVTAQFADTVGRMIICNATVVLRPTLAWDDINAK